MRRQKLPPLLFISSPFVVAQTALVLASPSPDPLVTDNTSSDGATVSHCVSWLPPVLDSSFVDLSFNNISDDDDNYNI